ncbi:hypothetical protein [Mucilaginibacter sp. NFR10]|uniref:DUF6939 family protein n=1 Tax=Mucilaginibacter sp. NFR10 TaxID=1566292 RepID=UPI0008713AEA|nr:hypothetical protein [Mucilaginibacter sp. NFR10]SCW71920.1 hypothetical protein SAMN03159284_03454 [Mucilaginibacter sp. NFR10]
MIFIESKRKKLQGLVQKYPEAIILDFTSSGIDEYKQFSPFYPHGDIPVPFCDVLAKSVEGIWQGLKVFEDQDIDTAKFMIEDMKNIKRSVRKNGRVCGHRKGVYGTELLDYQEARKKIYLKTYAWVLDHKLQTLLGKLTQLALQKDLVFLDYETNIEIENLEKPLSHAGLVKRYLEKKTPAITLKKSIPNLLF